MKKILSLALLFLSVFSLASCKTTVIPNSAEAEEKLKNLGYDVNCFVQYGDDVASQKITQVTVLRAYKGEDQIEVFFFANEEDTETFYKARTNSLASDTEILKKNKYSIYRGTEQAVADFLS